MLTVKWSNPFVLGFTIASHLTLADPHLLHTILFSIVLLLYGRLTAALVIQFGCYSLNLSLPGSSAVPKFHAVPGSVPAAVPLQRR